MPRVPVITPQVDARPLPGPRLDSGGSQSGADALGRGVQAVGSAVAGIGIDVAERRRRDHEQAAQRAQEDAERARRLAEKAALDEAENTLALWEAQAIPQMLQTRGRNAIGITPLAVDVFDKQAADAGKALSGDAQRSAWADVVGRRRAGMVRSLETHSGAQLLAFADEQHQAKLALLGGAATSAAAGGDDATAVAAIRDADAEIARHGEASGKSAEQITEQRRTALSRASAHMLDTYVNTGQDAKAEAWIERHGSDMDPDDIAKARRALDDRGVALQAQRLVDGLVRDPHADLVSVLSAIHADASLTSDARGLRVQDEATKRAAAMFRLRADAIEQRQDATLNGLAERVSGMGALASADRLPAAEVAELDLRRREALDKLIERRRRGDDSTTAAGEYAMYRLRRQLSGAEGPQAQQRARDQNLLLLAGDLSQADLKLLTGEQQESRKPDRQQHELSLAKIAQQTLAMHGIAEKSGGKDTVEAVRFDRELRAKVQAAQAKSGRPLDDADIQAIALSLMTLESVASPGVLWGTNTRQVRRFMLGVDPRDPVTVLGYGSLPTSLADFAPDRVASARAQLRTMAEKRGLSPDSVSDDDVLSYLMAAR